MSYKLLLTGFAVAIAMLAGIAAVNWKYLDYMDETAGLVTRAERTTADLSLLLLSLINIEADQRSYLLTRDPAFLPPIEDGLKRLPGQHQHLESLLLDPEEKQSLAALEELIAAWTAVVRGGWPDPVSKLFAGKQLAEKIRVEIGHMTLRQQRLVEARATVAAQAARAVRRTNLIGTALSILLLAAVFSVLLRQNHLRRLAESQRDRFFDFSPDLFGIAGSNGHFRQVNPAFSRTLGWSAKELLAQPFIEFVHPDDRAATIAEVKKLASGEATTHFENRYRCKDGSWKRLEWRTAPQPDGTLYAAARDVTEETFARRAASDSDALRNAVLNSMMANIAVVDRDGTLIAINEGWERFALQNGSDAALTGLGVGINYLEVCETAAKDLGAEIQGVLGGVRNVLERAQPTYEYEYPCDSPTEHRWFNMHVAPLDREEGGAVITHLNTTRRKVAELAMHESEEKFRIIADNNADVIWLSDPGITKFLYVNEAYERIWDRTRESLYQTPQSFLEPIHPLDRYRVLDEHSQRAERGWDMEYRIFRPDGTQRWIRDRGYPIRDEQGEIYRVTGIATDITQRKQFETAMAEKTELLEAALKEVREVKTLLLRNDRLASLGRLCAGLIHEVNNPLNFAAQGIFLLKRNSADIPEASRGDFLEILDDVEEGITRVVRLVSDLRGFTRVTDDHSQTFELEKVVETSLRFFSHLTKEGVVITVDIPPAMVVRGDPNHVTQVLINMLQNALDGIRAKRYEAGVSPEISVAATFEDQKVILRIRDNGLGILPEILEKIFDPFFTTKDVGAGMGLGLAISHHIMIDYGGEIDVHTVPGEYCEFVLTFLRALRTC